MLFKSEVEDASSIFKRVTAAYPVHCIRNWVGMHADVCADGSLMAHMFVQLHGMDVWVRVTQECVPIELARQVIALFDKSQRGHG